MDEKKYKIFRKLSAGVYEGTRKNEYKQRHKDQPAKWAKISRINFVGQFGEPCKFHLRMFEIAPGGFSSFEKHEHIHAVIAASGSGYVLLENEWHPINSGDVVYIGDNVEHQLRCKDTEEEAFSFFCIVDADRDAPIALENPAEFEI